jgi:hypothetical protein
MKSRGGLWEYNSNRSILQYIIKAGNLICLFIDLTFLIIKVKSIKEPKSSKQLQG